MTIDSAAERWPHLHAMQNLRGLWSVWFPMLALLLFHFGFSAAAAEPSAEIVVAIRYLQAEGVSRAHLYLYREDGRLLRQLTQAKSGQDRNPVFAEDGKTIVFTHEVSEGVEEWLSIEPRGSGLRRLDAAPDWYRETQNSPHFTNAVPKGTESVPGSPGFEGEPAPKFRSPDEAVELELGEAKGDENNGVDGPGHGGAYVLRDLKSGQDSKMRDVSGFEGLWELMHCSENPRQFFLFEGKLRVAFFGLHLDSTEGDTTFALDLRGEPRLKRLSPGLVIPFVLPGEPEFLGMTYERYLPIPGSPKSANCSYVEHWDAELKNVRYAKAGTAPLCYGASMYRPGKKPAVVSIRGPR